MGTTTISLRDEAYERLKARKREGESFSDVVLRLAGEEKDFHAGFGLLEDTDIESAVGEVEDELDEAFERRRRELFEDE